MRSGPFTYLWLVIKTASRHSLHATHSIILALIILAGLVTSVVPQVEVLVDLHGWHVGAAVLGGIIAVRLLLAPYWIWRNDQGRLAVLIDQVANKVQNEHRLAARTAALDDIAEEIAWAVILRSSSHQFCLTSAEAGHRHPSALAPHSAFPRSPPVWRNGGY